MPRVRDTGHQRSRATRCGWILPNSDVSATRPRDARGRPWRHDASRPSPTPAARLGGDPVRPRRDLALPLLTAPAVASDSRQNGLPPGGSIVMVILDDDRCYRAVTSRDARFDGQFVTAVRTTGIYCRPSCPAVTPKRTNVEFWP